MLFLALETSCDETAAALFDEQLQVRASVVASQLALHARFGGVVPEVAARAHLTQLLPVIDTALKEAGATLSDVGAVAVMNRPGLIGALLVAVSAAKMLAVTLDVPLIDVNHIEAHIYACRLAAGRDIFPCLGLVVSGGHTTLFDCAGPLAFRVVGRTIDDAAGEAFDKVAALLGLGFPGGPAVERAAATGRPQAFDLPRAFLREPRLDFSFSGLKTAVRYLIRDLTAASGSLTPTQTADVAASFQQAVVDVLTAKCQQGLKRSGLERLAVGGGVVANSALRQALEAMTREQGCELFLPPLSLCTDNAAMAAQAVEKWRAGLFAPLDLDASAT
ncbi:MAG TPA: tRNA (adenosine(37)-N6)-threonylcarbamoyltransferase complex transferase subunit TsaD [Gemmatales bacterium]|nr:tRNA (adenosine(37)-N6)-threonylcarbamoyltransferase complex transferase subunit TsaD [Gemmatales bacterium]HMP60405.1 tRNA (adenosine(37)-N6)-threonylcarbamoyltransferase complex transferase subunit TsaD [Gemmatales bacterium]